MPSQSEAPAIPDDAGLKPGRSEEPEPRNGSGLLDAAERGEALTPRENDDLVAYYLSNEELPGDKEVHPVELTLGHAKSSRKFNCELHSIEWEEWQDGRVRATNEKTGEIDTYVWASWNVARALAKPQLGPTVTRLQREDPDKAPEDASDLLRRMFRKQSGALLELSAKVLEISRLSNENNSVREVEAAKN